MTPRDTATAQATDPQGLPGRERDVSVCFIDLRGYTRHTETNAPSDVYRFLSDYFRVVAEVVRAHGGTLVEFQGDGVVIAFGALDDRADKEAAAVRTAREIRRVTRALGIPVRVGIATGAAFVGELSVPGRCAFCVVGAPTVMASRLQHLADELGAGIVVDDPTRRAAGALVGVRRHRCRTIRGSARRHDVFTLHDDDGAQPGPAPAAAPALSLRFCPILEARHAAL